MRPRALVIDDDAEILRTVGDILESLHHDHDSAGDQATAWRLFTAGAYDYVLLDLEIPVKPGKLCRIENGKTLLRQIRETPGMESMPVIVMTGHGNDSPDLAVSVMKDGAVDYVKKPFDRGELDEAIRDALQKNDFRAAPASRAEASPRAIEPFSAKKREMVIYENRATICGIEVWKATYQNDMREILVQLSRQEGGGYVRISGPRLNQALGRDSADSPVGRLIKSFRDSASKRLAEGRSLECGRDDIIASKGGYHFTEWMDVRVQDTEVTEPSLNARQQWVLNQIDQGARLCLKAVIEEFQRACSEATIKRDLRELREQGLITTEGGYYTRVD